MKLIKKNNKKIYSLILACAFVLVFTGICFTNIMKPVLVVNAAETDATITTTVDDANSTDLVVTDDTTNYFFILIVLGGILTLIIIIVVVIAATSIIYVANPVVFKNMDED